MYESKLKYYYGTGRRKHSVARVRIYPGSGNVTVNGRGIDDYFGLETLKLIVRQPLALTETSEKFDIVCTVAGGGEHCAFVRERVCAALGFLDIALDSEANAADAPLISAAGSRVVVGVEPTNEEWVAARDTLAVLGLSTRGTPHSTRDLP